MATPSPAPTSHLRPSASWSAVLYLEEAVAPPSETLVTEVAARLGIDAATIQAAGELPAGEPMALLLPTPQGVDVPGTPGILIQAVPAPDTLDDDPALATALDHTWAWPEARGQIESHEAQLIVADMQAAGLPVWTRLSRLLAVVRTLIELVPTTGVQWEPPRRIIDPRDVWNADETLRDHGIDSDDGRVRVTLDVLINVRLHGPDELGEPVTSPALLDTLGLGAFGLPDIEMRLDGKDGGDEPDDAASLLYDTAYYLLKVGSAIADGDTMEGVTPGSLLTVRHRDATVPPGRSVYALQAEPREG